MARVIGKRVIIKNDIGNIDDNVKWSRTDCVGRMIYLIPTLVYCFGSVANLWVMVNTSEM